MGDSDDWWQRALGQLAAARDLGKTGHELQAYHLAGEAVEFALKAIYLRRALLTTLPDEAKGAQWHSIPLIAERAGLAGEIRALQQTNRTTYANWLTVRDWKSNARFAGNKLRRRELNDLFLAVCHERDGIMKWLDGIFQPN